MASQPATPTSLIKFEVERFLATSDPEILCIRGYWGVGKTYFWSELLKASEKDQRISLSQYSYVSLFGVQTLDELKLAIFENTVETTNVGKEPNLETFADNLNAAFEPLGRKLVSRITEVIPGLKNLTGAIQSLSFMSVTERIVCIDDIERKGEKLRVIDILGLMQLLRDRRRCKVVLILNDQQLEGADSAALARYHEKSIDHSLVFAPSPAESCEIAIRDPDYLSAYLTQRCIKLDLTNIRVIQRLDKLLKQIQPLLADYHVDVQRQAVSTLALLGSLHFSRTTDDEDDFLDFALNRRGKVIYDTEEKMSAEEKNWDRQLNAYGYSSTDDLDMALFDGKLADESSINALRVAHFRRQ